MDIEELIARWDERRKEDQEKFQRYFPESDDLLAVVLRGHLLVEGYLDRLNRHCFHYPQYYDQAGLSFVKKLLIAKAQVLVPHSDREGFFDAIAKLNELRNDLAHHLESSRLEEKVAGFLGAVKAWYPKDGPIPEHIQKEKPIEKQTGRAIAFILGQMEVLDMVVEFMEKSRTYGSKGSEPGNAPDAFGAR